MAEIIYESPHNKENFIKDLQIGNNIITKFDSFGFTNDLTESSKPLGGLTINFNKKINLSQIKPTSLMQDQLFIKVKLSVFLMILFVSRKILKSIYHLMMNFMTKHSIIIVKILL